LIKFPQQNIPPISSSIVSTALAMGVYISYTITEGVLYSTIDTPLRNAAAPMMVVIAIMNEVSGVAVAGLIPLILQYMYSSYPRSMEIMKISNANLKT